jgi:glycosyltransferase involved in cell wall biosynthesis
MILLTAKLITFNRAPALRRTLDAWFHSDLRTVPLEILDNASTDDTPDVIADFRARFPGLAALRHRENLGVCGNLLRAMERFESEYCWMLGDDDEIREASAQPLLAAVRSRLYEAVVVAAPERSALVLGAVGTGAELAGKGVRLYHAATFLPTLIFRREFLGNGTLMRCNKAASTAFPHLPLIDAVVENARTIRIMEDLVIQRAHIDKGPLIRISGIYQIVAAAQFVAPTRRSFIYRDMFAEQIGSVIRSFLLFAGQKRYGLCTPDQWMLLWGELICLDWRFRIGMLAAIAIPRRLFVWGYALSGRPTRAFGKTFLTTDRM